MWDNVAMYKYTILLLLLVGLIVCRWASGSTHGAFQFNSKPLLQAFLVKDMVAWGNLQIERETWSRVENDGSNETSDGTYHVRTVVALDIDGIVANDTF